MAFELLRAPVKEFVNDKVVVVERKTSVRLACKAMAERDAHYAVTELGDAWGVLREKDVVRRVIAEGKSPDETSVEEAACPCAVPVDAETSLDNTLVYMRRRSARFVVVLGEDSILGVVDRWSILIRSLRTLLPTVILPEEKKERRGWLDRLVTEISEEYLRRI